MDMNAIRQQLQAEAVRRSQGQVPSSAGIPGGAATTNSSSPANPLARQLQTSPQAPSTGNPTMPTQDNPFGGALSAMNGALPKGGTAIEKAMIKRMNMYPPA